MPYLRTAPSSHILTPHLPPRAAPLFLPLRLRVRPPPLHLGHRGTHPLIVRVRHFPPGRDDRARTRVLPLELVESPPERGRVVRLVHPPLVHVGLAVPAVQLRRRDHRYRLVRCAEARDALEPEACLRGGGLLAGGLAVDDESDVLAGAPPALFLRGDGGDVREEVAEGGEVLRRRLYGALFGPVPRFNR